MGILIFWSFTVYGITSIIIWGSIFENPRNWIKNRNLFLGDLISCTLCTSTWVGFFMSALTSGLTTNFIITWWPITIFLDGMYSAGSVWVINTIVEYYENKNNTII